MRHRLATGTTPAGRGRAGTRAVGRDRRDSASANTTTTTSSSPTPACSVCPVGDGVRRAGARRHRAGRIAARPRGLGGTSRRHRRMGRTGRAGLRHRLVGHALPPADRNALAAIGINICGARQAGEHERLSNRECGIRTTKPKTASRVLTITGRLTNVTTHEIAVPPIRVTLTDDDKRVLYNPSFSASARVAQARPEA